MLKVSKEASFQFFPNKKGKKCVNIRHSEKTALFLKVCQWKHENFDEIEWLINAMTINEQNANTVTPEFSRVVTLSKSDADKTYEFKASEAECENLAKRFNLVALECFSASILLSRRKGLKVEGKLTAAVTQVCRVTLQPFSSQVEDQFSTTLLPHAKRKEFDPEEEFNPADEDIEYLSEDGSIDFGELLAQYLSLALDPFPRSPSVGSKDFVHSEGTNEPEEAQKLHALSKLSALATK